jgi:hypothetical protein
MYDLPQNISYSTEFKMLSIPEKSPWICHLFGHPNGLSYIPEKGKEPNWFHRKMQTLILGHVWVNTLDEGIGVAVYDKSI